MLAKYLFYPTRYKGLIECPGYFGWRRLFLASARNHLGFESIKNLDISDFPQNLLWEFIISPCVHSENREKTLPLIVDNNKLKSIIFGNYNYLLNKSQIVFEILKDRKDLDAPILIKMIDKLVMDIDVGIEEILEGLEIDIIKSTTISLQPTVCGYKEKIKSIINFVKNNFPEEYNNFLWYLIKNTDFAKLKEIVLENLDVGFQNDEYDESDDDIVAVGNYYLLMSSIQDGTIPKDLSNISTVLQKICKNINAKLLFELIILIVSLEFDEEDIEIILDSVPKQNLTDVIELLQKGEKSDDLTEIFSKDVMGKEKELMTKSIRLLSKALKDGMLL
jgi:hypothetical protein